MRLLNTFLFSFTLTIIFYSCDAPHMNPLESYTIIPDTVKIRDTTTVRDTIIKIIHPDVYAIEGYVTSMHTTPLAIENVIVKWNNDEVALTDGNGFFCIANIEKEDGRLYFSHDDYILDSLNVSWGESDTTEISFRLNMKPVLQIEEFYSIISNDHPDQTYGSLQLSGEIVDDNYQSISRIYIINPSIGFSRLLSLNSEHQFNILLDETDLGVDDIDEIVGNNFQVYVWYNHRGYNAGSAVISRVIRNSVEYLSPANSTEIDNRNPYLEWKRIQTGFDFTLTTEVYTNDIYPELVWSASNINSEVITRRVGTRLPNGEYFWVIWIVDENGNKSRSKPASFSIQVEE